MDPEPETTTPKREPTPSNPPTPPISSLPQKRPLEEDHTPSVPSPLNPNPIPNSNTERKGTPVKDGKDEMAPARSARTKKESLKKRESKGATDSARATPDPKLQETYPNCSPQRYKLPPPKPSDWEEPKGPVFTPHHKITTPDETTVEFHETSDHVYNKKNFHYTDCIADPLFPSSFYYRQAEAKPYGPHLSFEDAATHMYFDAEGRHVTTDKGFRMARSNVAVREGRWYWECKITRGIVKTKKGEPPKANGHVRLGFARREASLDAPVGLDAYSYGIRDKQGHKVHMSRPKAFFPPGEDMREGDVIGLEIQLPSEHVQRKVLAGEYNPAVDKPDEEFRADAPAANIVRDRIPIRFKSHVYFEKIAYHTTKDLEEVMNPSPASGTPGPSQAPNPNHPVPALRTLPGSSIKVYKNGVLMGTAFEDLLVFLPPASKSQPQPGGRDCLDDGMLGYYPAVSVFRGGAVEVNFGPKFWYPPPGYEGNPVADEDEVDMVGSASPAQASQSQTTGSWPPSLSKPRAVSQRYVEQIAEDMVWDIIDEVDFWVQDGCRIVDRTVKDEGEKQGGGVGAAAAGREEIKELVQDD